VEVNSTLTATLPSHSKKLVAKLDTSGGHSYAEEMELHLSPERQAQLKDYANKRGQDPAIALDEVLAAALAWEQHDYQEAVEGIRLGYADFMAGRVRPIEESFKELREKHGLPR
jgi:hypothetical protein